MSVTVELTREEEARLNERARRAGMEPSEYLRSLLEGSPSCDKTYGQRLLDEWEAEGVLGLFSDRPDSPEFAAQLRKAAEERG